MRTVFHMNFLLIMPELFTACLCSPHSSHGLCTAQMQTAVLTFRLLNQTNFRIRVREIWRCWCQLLPGLTQLCSVLQMLVPCPALAGISCLSSYYPSPGRPASLISWHSVQTLLTLDFLNMCFILLLWFLLFLNCFSY